MGKSRAQPRFHFEQTLGALPPGTAQQDRAKAAMVRMRGGRRVLLGVVADGEGGIRAGEAADLVVTKVLAHFSDSRSGNLTTALRQALGEAGRELAEAAAKKGTLGHVAATGIAVFHQRLFIAHAGNTQAFLVRGGKATPLSRSNERYLGLAAFQEPLSAPTEGIPLQPGDRIVVASASLTRASAEDRKPFVDPSVIPTHVEGSSPLEGARQLISVALGREVDANVTVLVVEIPGGRRSGVSALAVAAGLLAVAALAGLAVWLLPGFVAPEPVTVPDLGYIVLLDGSGVFSGQGSPAGPFESVSRLGTVPVGAFLRTSVPTKLALQSTDPSSPDLAEVQFHLEAGSEVTLDVLDPHPDPSAPGYEEMRNTSRLGLVKGRLVVYRRGGSWEYQIEEGDLKATLAGQGVGALGVSHDRGVTTVFCLIGTCALGGGPGGLVELAGGQSAEGDAEGIRGPLSISAQERRSWNDFCRGCLGN